MVRSIRVKHCVRCTQPAPTLFRVKYEEDGGWVFVCPHCWSQISENNPFYIYGGTWKAEKKKN